jgi:hypothetical protein
VHLRAAVALGRAASEIATMLFNPRYDDRPHRAPDESLPTSSPFLRALKSVLRVIAMMVAIFVVVTAVVAFRTWMWMPYSVQ